MQDFRSAFQKEWAENGGLVTKSVAAKLAGLSNASISDKIRTGEVKTVEFPQIKTTFIPLPAAMQLKRQRAATKPSTPSRTPRAQKTA